MLRFRDIWPTLPSGALDALLWEVLDPRHFLTAPGLTLRRERMASRRQSWEILHGRLLEPPHTQEERTFSEWNLYRIDDGEKSGEPLLSLKHDAERNELHVVRGLLCHVWEGYDSGGGVYLSRETVRWVRELTGTIDLTEFDSSVDLFDELVCRVFHAVIGASRLPLTSVETPLPDFSLGRLAYFYRSDEGAFDFPSPLNPLERVKLLETLLHRTPAEEMPRLAGELRGQNPLRTLQAVFNHTSLSPWTDLTEKSLLLADELHRQGQISVAELVDWHCSLLLQVTRHLTAYDLVTFHHRGANYPDALLLDLVLRSLLRRLEDHPQLFREPAQVRRRRALRQAWLTRTAHEGLPVPDAPTTPGEQQRVLPPPHIRVPEEQILQTARRRRLLHQGETLSPGVETQQILRQSLEDLSQPAEMRELGLALFLDRPLGTGKQLGEPDQTLLLSHRAFSRTIARRRLRFLGEKCDFAEVKNLDEILTRLPIQGVPLEEIASQPRPGAVSAADARMVAEDFVFLGTSPTTVRELYQQYDFRAIWDRPALRDLIPGQGLLLVPLQASGALTIHDRAMQPRLLLVPNVRLGYVRRAGREMLRAGLQAVLLHEDEAGTIVRLPPQVNQHKR